MNQSFSRSPGLSIDLVLRKTVGSASDRNRHLVANLGVDSVHILIDEVPAFDGVIRVEVVAQASASGGVQRRVAAARRLQQPLHHRGVELHLVPSLALRHHTSRHRLFVTGVLSLTLQSLQYLISVCSNVRVYEIFTIQRERLIINKWL